MLQQEKKTPVFLQVVRAMKPMGFEHNKGTILFSPSIIATEIWISHISHPRIFGRHRVPGTVPTVISLYIVSISYLHTNLHRGHYRLYIID
jgi:hypothetical protein